MEGYLHKYSTGFFFRKWDRRWFVIEEGNLKYYESREEAMRTTRHEASHRAADRTRARTLARTHARMRPAALPAPTH
jgi:hypothetical protein